MKYTCIAPILIACMMLIGCEAAIGDKCSSSSDCPTGTICDTDSPDGYCLVNGCEADEECPEGSTCIEFARDISYCLKKCSSSGDCRGNDYTCRDDLGSHKFCYVKPDGIYGRNEDNKVDFTLGGDEDNSNSEN